MGRIFLLSLLVLSFVCTSAYAGGAGNCVEPLRKTTSHWGIGGTFGYNYMNNRMNDLHNKYGLGNVRVKRLSQVYGGGILGIGDYVNLYGNVGAGNYDMECDIKVDRAHMIVKLHDGLHVGMGLNVLIPIGDIEPVSFGLGLSVQGNYGLNSVKELEIAGTTATSIGGSFYETDGQNSIFLTCKYTIDSLKTSVVPYVGGYHSWMVVGTYDKLTYYTAATQYVKKHYQGAYDVLSFGPLVGVDIDVAEYLNFNVEGRFIGETAITCGATLKY